MPWWSPTRMACRSRRPAIRVRVTKLAASMAQVAARTDQFAGTLYRGGRAWEVEMARIPVDGSHLVVCAVGGTAEQRWRQVARGARGTQRILGAA